jgi:hypothetical protein
MTNTTEKPVFIPIETSSFRILVIPAFLSFTNSCHSEERGISVQLFYFVCQCKIKLHFAEISPSSRWQTHRKTCFHSNWNVICPHSCHSRILVIPRNEESLSNYSISFVSVKLSCTLRRSLLRRDDKHNGKTCFQLRLKRHLSEFLSFQHSCHSRILVIPRNEESLSNYSISFVSVKLSFTLRRSLLRRDDKQNGKIGELLTMDNFW